MPVLVALPIVPAQQPVSSCSEQCNPGDPDVNDPPITTEGEVNMVLYAHWADVLQRAPMNLIHPLDWEPDLNQAFLMPTVDTNTPCDACNLHFKNNRFNMFLSSGPLAYSPEEGLHCPIGCTDPSFDIRLGKGPIVVYAYFSAEASPTLSQGNDELPNLGAGAMPSVRVEAILEMGPGLNNPDGFVARGDSPAFDVLTLPDGEFAYEARIVLVPQEGARLTLVRDGQVEVQVRPYQISEGSNEVTQREWRIRTGPDFPWRMVLPVDSPLQPKSLTTWIEGETFFLEWKVASYFGFTDLNLSAFGLVVVDEEGKIALGPYFGEAGFCNAMHCHFSPVRFKWAIPVDAISGVNGSLQFGVFNVQGTYLLLGSVEEPLTPIQGEGRSPGFEAGLLAVAAALGVALFRRRV